MNGLGRLFGVTLDASDDPWNLALKHASMWAQTQGRHFPPGPYEAMLEELGTRSAYIESAGTVEVASWLGPRPKPSDRPLITVAQMQEFVSRGGLLEVMQEVKKFVTTRILPEVPIMVGIDHSATGGVVSALSEALGADHLTLVVLDHHFDALPPSARMITALQSELDLLRGNSACPARSSGESYCCGNFLAHLLGAGVVKPEHLLLVGVGDYPGEAAGPEWASYREAYLALEKLGCGFFSLEAFEKDYQERLRQFLRERITTPYVYVSLDLDVGGERCVQAARYMDRPGIDRRALIHVAEIIAQGSQSGAFSLVGLDVMEFNMHLLGLETPAGLPDMTLDTAWSFLDALTAKGSPTFSSAASVLAHPKLSPKVGRFEEVTR